MAFRFYATAKFAVEGQAINIDIECYSNIICLLQWFSLLCVPGISWCGGQFHYELQCKSFSTCRSFHKSTLKNRCALVCTYHVSQWPFPWIVQHLGLAFAATPLVEWDWAVIKSSKKNKSYSSNLPSNIIQYRYSLCFWILYFQMLYMELWSVTYNTVSAVLEMTAVSFRLQAQLTLQSFKSFLMD